MLISISVSKLMHYLFLKTVDILYNLNVNSVNMSIFYHFVPFKRP